MGLKLLLLLHVLTCLSLLNLSFQTTLKNQSHFFNLAKQSLKGDSLYQWSITGSESYCSYAGITCDDDGYVNKIDVFGWSMTGKLPPNICSFLPKLRVLQLGYNSLSGGFPADVLNCAFLEVLNLTRTNLNGTVPDLSPLRSLRALDLSYNLFSGKFPMSLFNLTSLEEVNFNENEGFSHWQLPEYIDQLTKVRRMILTTCSIIGRIPPSIGNLTSLFDLQLAGNYLGGQIPSEIGKLQNLKLLELYYNELTGELPEELGNLTQLQDVDMSINYLAGTIPENICKLPKLRVLQLYNNSLVGEIPSCIGNSTTLSLFSLYENSLTGKIPANLGEFSDLVLLDLSENRLSGDLPPKVCSRGKLIYFLVLDNQLSGKLPESYSNCKSLLRFRVSNNRLHGSIPEGLMDLPHASIIDMAFNFFEGPIPKSIGNAKNLSALYLQNNRISGALPPEISLASNLVKIDLSYNLLSGPIPSQIGSLKMLNSLLLLGNKLDSSIPESLSNLKSLNVLNLSNNLLTGEIPGSLCNLLPNSLDFSNNRLSGPVPLPLIEEALTDSISGNPDLCVPSYFNSSSPRFPLCPQPNKQKRSSLWVIGITAGIVAFLAILLFTKHRFGREKVVMEEVGLSSWSSFSYDVKSFHKLSFDQREIVSSLIDKNVVGHGGSGTVYKIELSNGQMLAVKKLWTQKTKDPSSDQLFLDRELKAEVETLGNIRHKNIVKLYCYFSNQDSNLLVYEYMPNGNLWDALHRGKNLLDWPTRHMIALGIAQGLAYLHHDLLPPIIHRDIKSTNILLNADFQPKVADFGVAKVMQARGGKDSSTTVVAGTYGYLAPEYAYSWKATIKCDVYSFGVILMELITGKKPIDSEFGENKNIIFWVSQKVATKGAMDVLDKRLSGPYKEEMIQVLRIAIRCTSKVPYQRPTMNDVVQLLIEADPCRFGSCKSSEKLDKLNESSPTITPNNPSEF